MATEEITALLGDSAKMDMLVQGIERASRSLEIMTQIAMDGIKGVKSDIDTLDEKMKGTTDEAASGWKKLFDIQSAAMEEFWTKNEDAAKTFHDSELARMSDKQKKAERDLEERKTWAYKLKEAEKDLGAGGKMGLSAGKAAGSAMKTSALTSPLAAMENLPWVGPLLALFLQGKKFEGALQSSLRKGMVGVDLLGGRAVSAANTVSASVHKMYLQWASLGQEIGATADALTKMHIGQRDFERRATMGGQKLDESILTAATKLDMFGMNLGTTGQLIAAAYDTAGTPIKGVAEEVLNLGLVALGTNTNMQVLFNSMMTATSGLRLQRQGVADLAEVYLDLQAGLEAGGMDKNAAKAHALRGVELMGTELPGLNQGLMGYAVQRMQRQGLAGGSGDAFEALMQFRLGELPGTEGEFAGSLAGQLQGIAREQFGENKYRQIGGLEKQGLSLELARDIVMKGAGTDPEKLRGAFKDKQQVLNDAFKKRADRADQFEKITRVWQRQIQEGIKALVHMFAWAAKGFGAFLESPFSSTAAREKAGEGLTVSATKFLNQMDKLGAQLGSDISTLFDPEKGGGGGGGKKKKGGTYKVWNDTDENVTLTVSGKRREAATPAPRASSANKTSRTRSVPTPAKQGPTMTLLDGTVE